MPLLGFVQELSSFNLNFNESCLVSSSEAPPEGATWMFLKLCLLLEEVGSLFWVHSEKFASNLHFRNRSKWIHDSRHFYFSEQLRNFFLWFQRKQLRWTRLPIWLAWVSADNHPTVYTARADRTFPKKPRILGANFGWCFVDTNEEMMMKFRAGLCEWWKGEVFPACFHGLWRA